MTYRGHVKNGRITLDESVNLPEGVEVKIEIVDNCHEQPTIWDKLRAIAGTIDGPEDWARNHDHYIHGTPKRP
jgi:hypothetical protein